MEQSKVIDTLETYQYQILKRYYDSTSTGKVHINNMYIKYTFIDVANLLICQVLRAVPLPVALPLAIEV